MKVFFLLDQFSQTPSLKVNGKNSPKTIFGSIIGLGSILTLIIGLSYIIYDYYSRNSYTFSSYTDNSLRPDIDLKKLKMGFISSSTTGKIIPNFDRLFQFSAKHWDIYYDIITNKEIIQSTNVPIIDCSKFLKNDPTKLA